MKKRLSLAFLSTYPPRECGIATFSHDLIKALKLIDPSLHIKVAALNLTAAESETYPPEVVWQLNQEDPEDYQNVALAINADPEVATVVIQHEYGIFGADWGKNLLAFIQTLTKPYIIALHTVWENPPEAMFEVTRPLIEKASQVVVMSEASRHILIETYPSVDPQKITFIPHGIHPVLFRLPKAVKPKFGLQNRFVLGTFGLLSRNKGLEYILRGLPAVVAEHPEVMYLILGSTHPVVRRKEGESYRVELINLVEQLGLKHHVRFYDQYFHLEDILRYLQAIDVYIFTSLDPKQSVSGTFSYALGTGRAVITTAFNQAQEIITPATGRLVPMQNPAAFTAAILDLMSDVPRLETMNLNAYLSTRPMLWSNVAEEYLHLIATATTLPRLFWLPPVNLSHLDRMVDNFGLVQFAHASQPDYKSGYTLDDNARALIACLWLGSAFPHLRSEVTNCIEIFINFLAHCFLSKGRFINYIDEDQRTPGEQNYIENLDDSKGRAFWAIAACLTSDWYKQEHTKRRAHHLLTQAANLLPSIVNPRSMAMAILGLSRLIEAGEGEYMPQLIHFADELVQLYQANADSSWSWFEPQLTYANGLLPAALFAAGRVTSNKTYQEVARTSLEFLIHTCFQGDIYVPIGQKNWYAKGGIRSILDAQPEDPAAMLTALHEAFQTTHNPQYSHLGRKCFSWFLGNNLIGYRLYDPASGGCFDGLTKNGVNRNQGAESLVSYLISRCIIEKLNS